MGEPSIPVAGHDGALAAAGPRAYHQPTMEQAPTVVMVDLPGRAYPIEIGAGLLSTLGRRIRALYPALKATIVTDSNVAARYLDRAAGSLAEAGFSPNAITIPAGETSKSLDQLCRIYDRLAELRHGHDEPIIALGGGVVGDAAGLAAATWMRGVPFVQCPTTLGADIDASVGGKVAVNHPAGKNLIGAFHQPVLVLIDVDCLSSLDPRDYTAALAESVKHALIRDASFLKWHEDHVDPLRRRSQEIAVELIVRNCRIKAEVVREDERETSDTGVGRAALNLGHTIGHALEIQSSYGLRHGEAVSLGMVAALDLAVRCCNLADADRRRIEELLNALGLPIRTVEAIDADDLTARLGMDKKDRRGTLRFVVLQRIGEVVWLENPPVDAVKRAITRLMTPL